MQKKREGGNVLSLIVASLLVSEASQQYVVLGGQSCSSLIWCNTGLQTLI